MLAAGSATAEVPVVIVAMAADFVVVVGGWVAFMNNDVLYYKK